MGIGELRKDLAELKEAMSNRTVVLVPTNAQVDKLIEGKMAVLAEQERWLDKECVKENYWLIQENKDLKLEIERLKAQQPAKEHVKRIAGKPQPQQIPVPQKKGTASTEDIRNQVQADFPEDEADIRL